MSTAEETIRGRDAAPSKAKPIGDRILDFLSSVRFGVTLLCALVVLSMIGMLIIQQNVEGFDAYYASLTPAEKLVYGSLGFFDIYYAWYFKALLLILSLNIILASNAFRICSVALSPESNSATALTGCLRRKSRVAVSLGFTT